MRITVDRDKCDGVGMCESLADDFFRLDDDDVMEILDEHPGEEHRKRLTAAVASCPMLALSLTG